MCTEFVNCMSIKGEIVYILFFAREVFLERSDLLSKKRSTFQHEKNEGIRKAKFTLESGSVELLQNREARQRDYEKDI